MAYLKKTMCIHASRTVDCVSLKITDIWQLSLLNIHAADTVRKHIMLSIRKPVLSVLNMQKIININCSQCII